VQLNERLVANSQKLMLVEQYLMWSSSTKTVTLKLLSVMCKVNNFLRELSEVLQDRQDQSYKI